MKQRRNTPKYKQLYEQLLKSMSMQEEKIQFTDSTPTHRVRVYDTIAYTYDIKCNSDEEAQNFDPAQPNAEIISMEREMWHSKTEVYNK